MKILHACAVTAFLACGKDAKTIDAPGAHHDAANDAPSFPAPPTLGAQIDRMGRPALNTALNSAFQMTSTAKTAKKDAYNHASNPATWATTVLESPSTTVVKELASNLAILDSLDTSTAVTGAGCGNTALYTGPASPTSYNGLAGLLADDELYLDTSIGVCDFYLAIEAEIASTGAIVHDNCGGRAPANDVMDTTYSLLAAGLNGFDASLNPIIGDGVAEHTDLTATFPYLGAPH